MSSADTQPPSVGIGRTRQGEIYVGRVSGAFPPVPVSIERLDRRA